MTLRSLGSITIAFTLGVVVALWVHAVMDETDGNHDVLPREDQDLTIERLEGELRAMRTSLRTQQRQFDGLSRRHAELLDRVRTEPEAADPGALVQRLELLRVSGGGVLSKKDLTAFAHDVAALGSVGIEAMIDCLDSEEATSRSFAAQILGELDTPAAILPLRVMAVDDADEMAAAFASDALSRNTAPEAVAALLVLMKTSRHESTRINAMFCLCRREDAAGLRAAQLNLKNPGAAPAFRGLLANNILALETRAVLPIVETLIAARDGPDYGKSIVVYLDRVGGEAARGLLALLRDDARFTDTVRAAASRSLDG